MAAEPAFAGLCQEFPITVESGIETGFEHLFGLGRGGPELQDFQRAELWNQFVEKSQKTFARTGFAIVLAPFAFIIRARQIEQELSLCCVWNIVLDLIFLEMPGDSSGFRNQLADVAAIRIENFLFVHEHVFQFEAISLSKGLLEHRPGDFESDEVMVAIGSIAFPRDFEHVKTKFSFHVRQTVVLERNAVTVLLAEAGIQNRNGAVSADAVAVIVRSVMGEGAECESVFREILRIVQQSLDEIAAADVMREIAEERAAVGIVAHVLNDGAPIGVGLRAAQIFLGGLRKFSQQQRLDVRLPCRINDGFVREHRVGTNGSRHHQQNGEEEKHD